MSSYLRKQLRGPAGLTALLLAGCLTLLPAARAQTLAEQNTAMGMSDTLNAQSTGPNPGAYLGPAQAVAGQVGTAPGMPGMPGMDPNQMQNVQQNMQQGVTNVAAKIATIQVIAGTRVFDSITGELVDDATEQQVPATDRDNYFDDGTHGDIQANDGKYTKVDERRDVIGQSNQRIKERLVQALLSAEGLNPLEFYGFTLMSTEREESVSRGRAWSLVRDPKGGVGFVLAEVPTSEPVSVPKYRKWQAEKDQKVKEEWAERFLREYRINKDNISSEFFQLYVPQPPPLPLVDPPLANTWQPFSDPTAGKNMTGGAGVGGAGDMPGMMGPGGGAGVTGAPVGNASSRYF